VAAMEYLPENKRSLAWQRNFSEPSAEDPEQWIQIMAKEIAAGKSIFPGQRWRGMLGRSSGSWQRVKNVLPVGRSCRSGRKAAYFSEMWPG